jgi:hypothetical protein
MAERAALYAASRDLRRGNHVPPDGRADQRARSRAKAKAVTAPDRVAAGYQFTMTCPYDGALITPIADGRPDLTRASAGARCTECGGEYLVVVEVSEFRRGRR